MNKANQLALAAATAALLSLPLASPVHASEEADGVKCQGINSCKGQSECATATSSCHGSNACKGQGWITVPTAEECTKQGGKVI